MTVVSALIGKSSVQIQIDNADKRNSNASGSNIKGKASHKIVSVGMCSALYIRTKFTNILLLQQETCCVT